MANNKYLKSCDPNQEAKHIIYVDANNLYGYECQVSSKRRIQMDRS